MGSRLRKLGYGAGVLMLLVFGGANANTYTPDPVDSEFFMQVGEGPLTMDGKGRLRIWLTCPVTEASAPCRGRVLVKSRKGWPVRSCGCAQTLIGYNAMGRFLIPTGKTQSVIARLPRRHAKQILDHWEPRKVFLLVTAEDVAGNRQMIRQFRKLVPR